MSVHPARKAIALAAPVAGVSLAFPAAGQQVANVQQDRTAYLAATCDHVPDLNKRTGCRAAASVQFDQNRTAAANQATTAANQTAAAADQRAAAAQELQRCIAYLGQKRDSGTVFDRTITRENVCPYARELGLN